MTRCALRGTTPLSPQREPVLWPLFDRHQTTSCLFYHRHSLTQDRHTTTFSPLFLFLILSFHSSPVTALTMKHPVIKLFIILILQILQVSKAISWQLPEVHTLIDLTHPLNNNTLHWLTLRPFEMKITHNGTKVKGKNSYW